MRLYIQPYDIKSEGAAVLASSLGAKRIKHENSTYKSAPDHLIINWGSKKMYFGAKYLNSPDAVAMASNKLDTFNILHEAGVNIPEFTVRKCDAQAWWEGGRTVIARTLLNSSEGKGIIVCRPGETPPPEAKLYTKYIRKKEEYRVHVFDGQVIDIAEKRKKLDYTGESVPEIRSYRYGWVFCREDLDPPLTLEARAKIAVKALKLDFGAVDLIYNEKADKLFVLEVNTAPGIEGTTVENYTNAIKAYLQKQQNAPTPTINPQT